jgi:uncharacterized membrane protein YphA (DoxX/SURF4 family)
MRKELDSAWWMLRIGFGLVPVLAGLDKILRTNLLADWPSYISPIASAVVPMSGDTFMQIVGAIELVVGVAVLTVATRIGAYVAAAWLVAIAVNLVTTGQYFDIAVRDVLLAVAAYTLARLTEVREGATVGALAPVSVTGHAAHLGM